MAVIQISKIQVRRGLEENLPQLASGEMGWSVDTQRLWIGNGTIEEGAPEIGNTEIVTSGKDILSVIKSYTFNGRESGYTSRTGPSILSPVNRYFQDKLDDQISTRDFDVKGDGTTDDTVALQRAIDQVFPKNYYNTVGVRRRLHIPAGTYIISSNIVLPPYASIFGDGPRSTIIKLTSGTDPVLQFKDSLGNIGATTNTVTSDAPFQIDVADLTLQTATNINNIVVIDNSQIITFDGVRFQGNVSTPIDAGNSLSAVSLVSTVEPTTNIVFNRCEFARINFGITAEGNVSAISINNSLFDTLYRGIVTSANVNSPQGIKITSSKFDNIAAEAVRSADNGAITTAFNYYATVGYGNASVVDSGTAGSAVLSWNTPNNYSIGDVFERSLADQAVYQLIEIISQNQSASMTQAITAGSVQDQPGGSLSLAHTISSATNLGLVLTSVTQSAIIDYRITRGSHLRIGTMRIAHSNGTSVIYEDDYSQTDDIGISLSFLGNATTDTATLQYTSTTYGNATAYFKYTVRSFI
jgi:hypothetical protein